MSKTIYKDFYFGHGGSPDSALWKIEDGSYFLQINFGRLLETVEEAQEKWDLIKYNPLYFDATVKEYDGLYSFSYWKKMSDNGVIPEQYERDEKDSWGGGKTLDEYPYEMGAFLN